MLYICMFYIYVYMKLFYLDKTAVNILPYCLWPRYFKVFIVNVTFHP